MNSNLVKVIACDQQLKRKRSRLLSIDIIIEVICFINKRCALSLASTSRIVKYFIEKLSYYPLKPRIVPEIIIITMLGYKSIVNKIYNNYTYVIFPAKILRSGYYGRHVWRRLPSIPPPNEIAGFGEISLEVKLSAIMRSSNFLATIGIFFNNIRHLITHKTHFLHIHCEVNDYICCHDLKHLAKLYKNANNEIYRIPEFDKFLDWLHLFDLGTFKFLRITSATWLFFTNSARLNMLLSQLLNDSQILSVTYLEIQNDIYGQHHMQKKYPLQLSSIAKWLFYANGPNVLHIRSEYSDGQFGCICPIDDFLIPLIKYLLNTCWAIYPYLVLLPICTDCFDFNLTVGHPQVIPYLNNVINDMLYYFSARVHNDKKFEIFLNRNYLYLRRSPLFGPLEKEIDPEYSWNYFNNEISIQHAIKATIIDKYL